MKKILSIWLFFILLYQAGGFALQYLAPMESEAIPMDGNAETMVVKIPISLPYQTNWEAPREAEGELRKGDEFYQMVDQKMENDTLYTTIVADQNARDRFFDLANQVSEHLSDQPEKAPAKSKLIQTLVKEYCSSKDVWVFYIVEWPGKSILRDHAVLAPISFSGALDSPPQHS
jgi:hypothetical protein